MEAVPSSSLLVELLDVQGGTRELLDVLSKKLSVVSSSATVANDGKLAKGVNEGTHLSTAVGNQYSINQEIRRLIDELVV